MPLTPDSSVRAVIAAFLRTAGPGEEARRLRGSLSHVDAEIGTMPIRNVRTRHLTALLDDLRRAGLSERRVQGVVDAAYALFAWAGARGIVGSNPLPEPEEEPEPPKPSRPPRAARSAAASPTPTMTMVALGFRVAFWTAWVIMVVFAALLILLLVELG